MVSRDVRRFLPLFLFVLGFLGLLAPTEASADSSERPDRSLFGTISSGGGFNCAVTSTSDVKCWGLNHVGQLGNGNTNDSLIPVQVQGLSGSIESVIATSYNSCALDIGGRMRCWGANHRGQLGDGAVNFSPNPLTQVSGLISGVRAMAGSEYFNCALLHSGEVKCWGETYIDFDNDGIEDSSNTPVTIPGLPQDIVAISASSGKFICVVSVSTGVWCWGENSHGQLGDSTNSARFTPVRVSNLTTSIASLSSGQGHTCIVTNSGTVKCWGSNGNGKLGEGTQNNSNIPRDVVGLSGPAIAVTAGYHHTCALLVSGTVQCWGGNASGQLGDGTTNDSNTPVSVQGLTSAVEALTGGWRNSCVLSSNGEIKCWGDNTYGQIGDGTNTNRSLPVSVLNFVGATTTTTTSTTTSSPTTTQAPAVTSTTSPQSQSATTTTLPTAMTAAHIQAGGKTDSLPATGGNSSIMALVGALIVTGGITITRRRFAD
jgi:LPXTG-motif cell wall-anchored protein